MNLLRYVALVLLATGCCEQTLPTIPPDPATERIFYSRASGTFFSIISTTSEATEHRTLAAGRGYITSTPYHYRIAAVHSSPTGSSILTATTSAKQQIEFAPNSERPATCALSNDGTRIAYTTMEGNLYTAKLDGSENLLLSQGVFPLVQPSFSHDNTRIAFVGSTAPGHSLYIINVDATGLISLAPNADTSMHSLISWAPNNSSVLFTGIDALNGVQIYIVNSQGANLRPITASIALKSDPIWSPNGYKIAFSEMTNVGNYDIFICNPDGSAMQNITGTAGDSERYPHWSPEGTRLLFTANEPPLASLRLIDTTARTITTIAGDVYGRGFWDYSGR